MRTNKTNHYGQSKAQSLGESITSKHRSLELPCVRLSFDTPKTIAVYCGDDTSRNPLDHYYRASFGSENCLHTCHLAPGINIIMGDFIEITAINANFNITHGATWNAECFASHSGGSPSWIEE